MYVQHQGHVIARKCSHQTTVLESQLKLKRDISTCSFKYNKAFYSLQCLCHLNRTALLWKQTNLWRSRLQP